MKTVLLDHAQPGALDHAAQVLQAGGLVALPTETVYGLAGDAASPAALAAIFEAKERPLFDPLIVHLPEAGWLDRLTAATPAQRPLVRKLVEAFWPGPLTVILPRRPEIVPDLVTSGGALVAVRVSAHPVFADVIARFGRPLAAPSANRFGRISPTTGAHAMSELAGRVDLIIEAGATAHGVESTVVLPSSNGSSLEILRPGPITAEMLAEFTAVQSATRAHGASPGQTAGHYAPITRLMLMEEGDTSNFATGRVGYLGYRRDRPPKNRAFAALDYLSTDGDLREAATRLFAALRRLDEAGLDLIIAERVPDRELGRAINDRLTRAAAGSVTA